MKWEYLLPVRVVRNFKKSKCLAFSNKVMKILLIAGLLLKITQELSWQNKTPASTKGKGQLEKVDVDISRELSTGNWITEE